ncbi:cytochrome oxidase biogenesis protein Surf1 facilitates heme A insertion [Vibrio tubiashii]|nr:cytochrome oxidase biogenesis protein Surf1 facilitates heme A insertion [Vibrio tubiashii]
MEGSLFALLKSTKFVVACVVTVVAFSILINLGLWQLSRADEKSQIEQQVTQREQLVPIRLSKLTVEQLDNPTGVRVSIKATPVKGRYLLLDNQSVDGEVGYLALQLINTQTGNSLLLERGFVPSSLYRSELPKVDWLSEPFEFTGRLYNRSMNPLSQELHMEQGEVSRIQNLNFSQLQEAWWIDLEPYVVQPMVESWPYVQPWQPISMQPEKHLGYAVQWFSMAAVLAALAIGLLVRAYYQGVRDE